MKAHRPQKGKEINRLSTARQKVPGKILISGLSGSEKREWEGAHPGGGLLLLALYSDTRAGKGVKQKR